MAPLLRSQSGGDVLVPSRMKSFRPHNFCIILDREYCNYCTAERHRVEDANGFVPPCKWNVFNEQRVPRKPPLTYRRMVTLFFTGEKIFENSKLHDGDTEPGETVPNLIPGKPNSVLKKRNKSVGAVPD